ncbi:hypothetical protein LCGC14_0327560 [marine sediment metagenome]|uniref:Uncharacterized protein n=1 Tax=marine sediment metagenome TaxID=412755 RepID=A0A0F9TN05_9ZZZZ
MQVDSADARPDPPEECGSCGQEGVELHRTSSYGPGHQVTWHCDFCFNFMDPGSALSHNLAKMGHMLLKAIRDRG